MKFDAIVFDFDGVLVESVDIKARAFGKLYASYGQEIAQRVVDYHMTHAGISRYVKFKVWQEEFLGLPYNDLEGERLSWQFSRLVVDAVCSAEYVLGAEAFLKAYHMRLPLYVASGTPEAELREIVSMRNMNHFFTAVRGAPTSKGRILEEIICQEGYQRTRVLMVGDAMADWQAAQEAGTAFVGRVVSCIEVGFPISTTTISDLKQLPAFVK
jgi:phosphoglycolate phosphatase-like HAD superfamily hydrolase